jgi:nucleotide-binding universal stress UspA family protein
VRADGPVVIAIDGSEHSDVTLRWGLAAAERWHLPVWLVHVLRDPAELAAWGWCPSTGELDDLRRETLAAMCELRDKALVDFPTLHVEARLLHGPIVPALTSLTTGARMAIVGARRGRRPVLGSTGGHLAGHARCPVVVVRDHEVDDDAPVVVGVDGSAPSLHAAREAAREAVRMGRPLHVLHARPTIADPFGVGSRTGIAHPASTDVQDRSHSAARAVADELQGRYPQLVVHLDLVDDDPVHALVRASHDAALLVVGPRGLGKFRGMLVGAVSAEAMAAAHCPVLVARCDHPDGAHRSEHETELTAMH